MKAETKDAIKTIVFGSLIILTIAALMFFAPNFGEVEKASKEGGFKGLLAKAMAEFSTDPNLQLSDQYYDHIDRKPFPLQEIPPKNKMELVGEVLVYPDDSWLAHTLGYDAPITFGDKNYVTAIVKEIPTADTKMAVWKYHVEPSSKDNREFDVFFLFPTEALALN